MPPAPCTVAVKYLIKKLGEFPQNFQKAGAGWRAQRVGGGLPQEVSDLWPRGGSLPSPPAFWVPLPTPFPFLPLSPFPHPLQFSCPFNRPPSPSPYLAGAPGPGVVAPETLALLLLGS